ncbi:MAG TPA: adenylate/guanylate cyclase domain-containing protein [Terriglobales bacterium]|nr:adenylate/guanylate cyclase domain-containing protein [Terriglobales bacterium]
MSRIIISGPDGKRGMLELTKPLVSIGRGSANDLVLRDSSVSRFHAVLKCQGGRVFISDRNSTNGVIIGGERIADERQLRNNEVARVGSYELRYEDVRDSGILIKSTDLLATLNKVLRRGRTDELSLKVAGQVPSELTEQIKRLERENQLLSMLYDAGIALSSRLSLDEISEQVMNLAFRIEGVERGFMMLFDENGEVTRQSEVRYRRPPAVAEAVQPHIILSRAILDRIRTEQKPILVTDADTDERFTGSESMRIAGLRSAMCAPLLGRGKLFGILYVDNLERPHAFTQDEWNVFALLATQAGAAIETLTAHEQIARQVTQRAALERFLAPEVVEMVARNPEDVRLGGFNQKVSILFADIRDFTTMSEKMKPEKVVEILNHYFTHVTEIIFDHGGTLDKFLGDGVMAVFGAPVSKGNDAENSVRAAQAIQRLVVELNRDATARQWPEIRVGIGIGTGIVTAGNIGSPRRIDYTVIGDTVNTASRLMSNAPAGKIIISEQTARDLSHGKFGLRAMEPLRVKGKSKPVRCFTVEWRNARAAAR